MGQALFLEILPTVEECSLCIESTLFIDESIFSNNLAFQLGGALFLVNSYFQSRQFVGYYNNSAKYGGAVYTDSQNQIVFSGTVHFKSNSATYGGALSLSPESTLYSSAQTLQYI